MPDKLTDNEIVKALEICGTYKGKCTDCPAFVKVDRSNCKNVLLGAVEIINRLQEDKDDLERIVGLMNKRKYYRKFVDEIYRKQKGNELSDPDFDYIYRLYFEQKAEIERLEDEYEETKKRNQDLVCAFQTYKAEAYKEFAERVKMEFYYEFDELIPSIMADKIDNLLKELEGNNESKN